MLSASQSFYGPNNDVLELYHTKASSVFFEWAELAISSSITTA